MPLLSDIDGDTITSTIISNTCSYLISYAAGVLTISPAISDIGTCIVTVNLFDGLNNVPNPINIVSTNSPPSFMTAPTNQAFLSIPINQAFSSGHTLSYTIPITTDPDSDVVTIASTVTTCNYAASVLTGVLTMNAPIASIGTCTVTIMISDGINNVPYSINIVTTNSAPYFSSSLSTGETINAGFSNTYTFPATNDIDSDTVAISIS